MFSPPVAGPAPVLTAGSKPSRNVATGRRRPVVSPPCRQTLPARRKWRRGRVRAPGPDSARLRKNPALRLPSGRFKGSRTVLRWSHPL